MALPWVRLDSNVGSHDKVLGLICDPSSKKWQALASYFVALGWAGGQGTDGFVPRNALGFVHGTPQTARLLAKYGLWEEATNGWHIRNYEERQELTIVTESKRVAAQMASRKANCARWHGPDCYCWKDPQ